MRETDLKLFKKVKEEMSSIAYKLGEKYFKKN